MKDMRKISMVFLSFFVLALTSCAQKESNDQKPEETKTSLTMVFVPAS